MKARSFLLSFLILAAAAVPAIGVYAQGPPPDGPGQGPPDGSGPPGGNDTGNGTGPDAENGTASPGASGSAADRHARERALAQRGETGSDPASAWARALRDARMDPATAEHRAALEQLPPQARARLGLLALSGENATGRYVSFQADPEWGALHNVSVGGTVLFESIYFPPEENVTARHQGNFLELAGDTWRFHIVDTPAVPIHVRSAEHAVQFVLAPGATTDAQPGRLNVSFPRDDGMLPGRFVGTANADANVTGLLEVVGEATFQVAAQHVVLAPASDVARAALEAAKDRRAVGGEVTLLSASGARGGDTVSEVVPYEEVAIEVRSGEGLGAVPENASVHTVTLSADGIPGKTFVLNIDDELMDLDRITLRYYSVVDGVAMEVPIVAASSLEEALDPTGSGIVPRYWVLSGADGFQLLFTVPTFSTHVLEVLGFDREIIVKIVLTAGVLGAVAVIALAVAGLFRRPQDTL